MPTSTFTILKLADHVAKQPEAIRTIFHHMFNTSTVNGTMVLPTSMHEWTIQHFGSVEAVREQTIVKVLNRLTLEGALFNPARALRPALGRTEDTAIDTWVAKELHDDVFAEPLRSTPEDVFGRIRGKHCITASNIAKYDGWHAVVICDEAHPLHFNAEQVHDYVDVAWRWVQAAHKHDPQAIYPLITWNCLPKSGASLAHGHLQVALARDMPYVRVESWRRANELYRATTGKHYYDDMFELHAALGLTLPDVGGVRRFAHLTPMRNHEVVLLDAAPTSPHALAQALFETLDMLIHSHGMRAFNAALAFPPLAAGGLEWHDMPAFARVGDRGNPLSLRSDVGVMELYGTNVITADPFEVVSGGYREHGTRDREKQ